MAPFVSLEVEAREYALSRGLIKYASDGEDIVNLPFTITPWVTKRSFVDKVYGVAKVYNRLYATVSQDFAFLREQLAPAAQTDDFVASMLACLPQSLLPKPQLFLTRNDFMPLSTPAGVVPKQVEINMIAASLGPASQKVNDLHRFIYREHPLSKQILPTHPGDEQVEELFKAWQLFGDAEARLLFILPPGEKGVFDQLWLVSQLAIERQVPLMRCTMEELGREGEIRQHDLYFRGRKVAVGYFRGGYSPTHYVNDYCWQARILLENSTAISVPSISAQLANMKKIQCALTSPALLNHFLNAQESAAISDTFMVMASPEQHISWQGNEKMAIEHAISNPEAWVLKPQREGGGNNLFGTDLIELLEEMAPESYPAFVLMEYIKPTAFVSTRLVNNQYVTGPCLCEFGVYGSYLMLPGCLERPLSNANLGYLLRTKDENSREGLVIGGFAAIDAVAIEPD